jgi:hypothetical protein
MKKSIVLVALLACAAPPALAQGMVAVAPAAMAPMSTEAFRMTAMQSDVFEIESSRMALQRSRSPAVQRFAQMMIGDHAATSQALNGGRPLAGLPGGPVGGAATGAAVGAVVGGPVGAVVGGAVGAMAGGISDTQEPQFRQYVVTQGRPSYRYSEEVRVGATLPSSGVTYYEVPEQYGVREYRYTVVNNTPVLVDPRSHRIVQVIR